MTASLPRRATTLIAACLLEVLLVMVLVRSLRSALPGPTVVMAFVSRAQLLKAASVSAPQAPLLRARPGRILLPQLSVPDARSLPQPSARFPPAVPSITRRVHTQRDWAEAARQAAADAAGQAVLTRQRLAALDELPDGNQPRSHASFPWSHQPLASWFDFDAHTLTTSLHLGKHCEFVLFVILPGFGCVLGHLDDESRGDLFDPALLPPVLQLPAPLMPAGQRSSSVTGPPAVMP